MKTKWSLLFALVAGSAFAASPLEYRFDDVKRTVMLKSGTAEHRAVKGERAHGGDRVETGWFSSTVIAAEAKGAKFEIFSSTTVTLAETEPGVILSLERGRIRAMFDKVLGNEPRIVKTPGALLAVRGTDFDVQVNEAGETTVDVYEGVVEVQSPLHPEPMFVRPGEEARFSRHHPPSMRPIPDDRHRDQRNQPGQRSPNARPDQNERDRRDPRRGGDSRGGMQGGGGGMPSTPPPPPPQKPPVDASF